MAVKRHKKNKNLAEDYAVFGNKIILKTCGKPQVFFS
jgi:hypothetical protein